MDAQVHRAGHASELAQKIRREGVIGFDVRTGHLNVDGRRQTEVQNLADDVGREKVEGDARETRAAARVAARRT